MMAACMLAAATGFARAAAPLEPEARKDVAPRQFVRVFDFDERPLGNYEDTPMYWRRFEGEGLPAYSCGRFDEEVGRTAPPSFRFDLRGGNIGYEYVHGDLVVFPDSDYLVEGYVRAEGLTHARAFLACYLVDRFGQRISGSERVSELAQSRPLSSGVWQRIAVQLHGNYPQARALRVQLWAMQRYVWAGAGEGRVDPIARQDVHATVWFDDLSIRRMPRIRVTLSNPGGLIKPGAEESFEIDAHNATLVNVQMELVVLDADGAEHFRAVRELAPQTSDRMRVPSPPLVPGWYRARARLLDEDETLLERTLGFAVLPAIAGGTAHRSDLGIDLGRWPFSDERGALELVETLACGAVRIGLPMLGAPENDTDVEYLRQIRDLARQLAMNQVRTTGLILPPATGVPDARESTGGMVAADPNWDDRVGPMLAYFGGYLLSWQLGDERYELQMPGTWNSLRITQVWEKLERYVAAPELIVPRSVLDAGSALPSDYLQAGTAFPANWPIVPRPPHAYAYWLPPELPVRTYPWYLAFWFEGEPDCSKDGAGPRRWLTVGLDRESDASGKGRVTDMARRIVLAKVVNPDRLFVPAPFDLVTTNGGRAWQPTREYIPLRTLFHYLSGYRAVAALALDHDGVAVLFSRGDQYTLVVWTWQWPSTDATVGLYVGEHAAAVELSGTVRSLQREGALVHVPLLSDPLIVTDVDAPLLLLQDSIRVEPSYIQSHDPEPRPVLKMQNHHGTHLAGRIDLQPPRGWDVAPDPISFELGPGQSLNQTLKFTIPPRQVASDQLLGVDLHLRQPELRDLHVDVPLHVELRDIVVRGLAWWDGSALVVEQTLHNLSLRPVNFNAFCQVSNRAQAEGAFLDVAPGDVAVQRYRFPQARDLAGGRAWIAIQEIDGPRTLDQLVSVPR